MNLFQGKQPLILLRSICLNLIVGLLASVIFQSSNSPSVASQPDPLRSNSKSHFILVHAYGAEDDFSGWIEDEEDACHSSPDEKNNRDIYSFSQIESESTCKQNTVSLWNATVFYLLQAHFSLNRSLLISGLPNCYTSPSTPFPGSYPSFLISSLPPPLSA